MLSGHFENCYGIKEFDMGEGIHFSRSNKALIYAPNGVMKTSFTKVFEDLSKGSASEDRIFSDAVTTYSIDYRGKRYDFTSGNLKQIPSCKEIYVINSFVDNFEFTKDTLSTLLADEETRKEYNNLMAQFSGQIKKFEAKLVELSGLTKPKVKGTLISDFDLPSTADWPDVINAIHEAVQRGVEYPYLGEIKYSALFHEKAVSVYGNPNFKRYIQQYIERLDSLLNTSKLLCSSFTDRNAETLTKTFVTNNLFSAEHKVLLKDGREIVSLDAWKDVVDEQLQTMYADETLSSVFEELKKMLNANNFVDEAKKIIIDYQQIIPLLFTIPQTKKDMWATYCSQMEEPSFGEYFEEITGFTEQVRKLYEKAATQSKRWNEVVKEFNRRFRVPFSVEVNNKSNFILKDEAPNLSFVYKRGIGKDDEKGDLTKDILLSSLSMGEQRAMYLLYILFDLERIRIQASSGLKHLIITDDIADSFDYKNKYAIIEYLADFSKHEGIDLLILTHNFDFYRTVSSRLGVKRENCYIAQKSDTSEIKMEVFRYQNDFFKKVIIAGIKGKNSKIQKKMLIASIPFYRNLAEYSGQDCDYSKLTCFLHFKTNPIETANATLEDLWKVVKKNIKDPPTMKVGTSNFYEVVQRYAEESVKELDEISLENKLIISIAVRLKAEKYLKQIIIANEGCCDDSNCNQMRDWSDKAKKYLKDDEVALIDEINLITPETIHLNTFMYEPLIDVSIWALNDIYSRTKKLQEAYLGE